MRWGLGFRAAWCRGAAILLAHFASEPLARWLSPVVCLRFLILLYKLLSLPSSLKRRIEYAIDDRPRCMLIPSRLAAVLLRAEARVGCRGRHSAEGSGRGCRLARRGCCVGVEARLWWRRSRGSSAPLETRLGLAIPVLGSSQDVGKWGVGLIYRSVRFWRWGMGVRALLLVGTSRWAWWVGHGGLVFITTTLRISLRCS